MPAKDRKAYAKKHPAYKMDQMSRNYSKMMRGLRKKYGYYQDNGKKAEAKKTKKQMQQLALRFNKVYNERTK